jgi:hypothetical protein
MFIMSQVLSYVALSALTPLILSQSKEVGTITVIPGRTETLNNLHKAAI